MSEVLLYPVSARRGILEASTGTPVLFNAPIAAVGPFLLRDIQKFPRKCAWMSGPAALCMRGNHLIVEIVRRAC